MVCQVSTPVITNIYGNPGYIYHKFKKSNSSTDARYLSLFSISLVLASTVGMCLNTMPSMAFYNEKNEPVMMTLPSMAFYI